MPILDHPPPQVLPPRLVFFGTASRFSAIVLRTMLDAGLPVIAAVVPAATAFNGAAITEYRPAGRPLRELAVNGAEPGSSVVDLSWNHAARVFLVRNIRHVATTAQLASLRPTLYVVACYPRRLPDQVLAAATLGGINVHPSALPAGRGPYPRFWAFHHGLKRTGVSVHVMNEAFDAGPIVAQSCIELPEECSGTDFDRLTATVGGSLVVDAVRRLHSGTAAPRPQDESIATYEPLPSTLDYRVSLDRPATWAYRFIAGVAGDGGPLHIVIDDTHVPIRAAVAVDPDGRLEFGWSWRDGVLWVQCQPGLLAVIPDRPVEFWHADARSGKLSHSNITTTEASR